MHDLSSTRGVSETAFVESLQFHDESNAESGGQSSEKCAEVESKAANLAASYREINPLDLRVGRSPEERETTSENEGRPIYAEITDDVKFVTTFTPKTDHVIAVNWQNEGARAVIEPSMSVSLVSWNVAGKYTDRLIPQRTKIRAATGEERISHHILLMRLEVDCKSEVIPFRVLDSLDSEMILGAEFAKKFELLTDWARDRWRLGDGQWREFQQSISGENPVLATLAGLVAIEESERMQMNPLERSSISERERTLNAAATAALHSDNLSAHTLKNRSSRWSPAVSEITKHIELGEEDEWTKKSKGTHCNDEALMLSSMGTSVIDWRTCRRRYVCFKRTKMKSRYASHLGCTITNFSVQLNRKYELTRRKTN